MCGGGGINLGNVGNAITDFTGGVTNPILDPLKRTATDIGGDISNTVQNGIGKSDNWELPNSGTVINEYANALAQVYSGGLVGVTSDGKLKGGFSEEALGEVTGRNAARKKSMDDAENLRLEKAARERERLFGIKKQEANERRLSGKSRQQQGLGSGEGVGGIASVEQQAAADFLGL